MRLNLIRRPTKAQRIRAVLDHPALETRLLLRQAELAMGAEIPEVREVLAEMDESARQRIFSRIAAEDAPCALDILEDVLLGVALSLPDDVVDRMLDPLVEAP